DLVLFQRADAALREHRRDPLKARALVFFGHGGGGRNSGSGKKAGQKQPRQCHLELRHHSHSPPLTTTSQRSARRTRVETKKPYVPVRAVDKATPASHIRPDIAPKPGRFKTTSGKISANFASRSKNA